MMFPLELYSILLRVRPCHKSAFHPLLLETYNVKFAYTDAFDSCYLVSSDGVKLFRFCFCFLPC